MARLTERAVRSMEPLSRDWLGLSLTHLWKGYWSESFGFKCIVFYLIFEYVKPQISYPVFALLPFTQIFLMCAALGFILDRDSRYVGSFGNKILILLFIQCILSSCFAYDSSHAFNNLIVIELWILIYFLIVNLVNTEKRLFIFILVYFLCNFKMSQFGFFSWAGRGFSFASWGVTGAGWFRNSGELGMQMAEFVGYLLFFIWGLRRNWGKWAKVFVYFVLFTAICTIVATNSRGALLGLAGVLLFASFFSKHRVKAWMGTVLLGLLVYTIIPPEFIERLQAMGSDTTSVTRLTYWTKALRLMEENPIWGIGYYNWVPYYLHHFFDGSLYFRVEEAHNTFLQIGAELGYVGLGIFIWMVLYCFYANFKSAKLASTMAERPFLYSLALGMNAAGVGLVLSSLFLTAFFMPNFWFHLALTVCLQNVVKKAQLTQEVAPRVSGAASQLAPIR